MINEYTVYINTKPFSVHRKAFVCHCTRKLKGLQTNLKYNKFILNHRFKDLEDVLDYIREYTNNPKPIAVRYTKFEWKTLLNKAHSDIVLASLMADYCTRHPLRYDKIPDYYYIGRMLDEEVNYNISDYSEIYQSLSPHLDFYHNLIFNFDNNTLSKQNVISCNTLDKILKKDYGIELEEVRRDIDKHNILLDMEDYFMWSSSNIKDWLYTIKANDIFRYSIQRRLSKIKYLTPCSRDIHLLY